MHVRVVRGVCVDVAICMVCATLLCLCCIIRSRHDNSSIEVSVYLGRNESASRVIHSFVTLV